MARKPKPKTGGTLGREVIHTDEQIIKAVRDCHGYITRAAKKLGVTYECLRIRALNNPLIRQVVNETRVAMVDDAEDVVRKHLKKNSLAAATFVLKTRGKNRGYVERTESRIGGDKNAPPISQAVVTINPDELPLEIRKVILEHLRKKKASQEKNHEQE